MYPQNPVCKAIKDLFSTISMADDFIQRLRRYAQSLETKKDIFKNVGSEGYNAQACAYRDALNILKMNFPELQEDNRRYFVLASTEDVREIGVGGYIEGELIPVADPSNGKLFLYRVEKVTELKDDSVVYHVKEEEAFVQNDFDPSKTTVFIKRSADGHLEPENPSMTRMLFKGKSVEGDLPQEEVDKLMKGFREGLEE